MKQFILKWWLGSILLTSLFISCSSEFESTSTDKECLRNLEINSMERLCLPKKPFLVNQKS